MAKQQGTVKWFNDSKGFGFISQDSGGNDLFVHFSNISGDGFKSLKEGQKVEYEIAVGPKGEYASNVGPLLFNRLNDIGKRKGPRQLGPFLFRGNFTLLGI